MITIAENPDLKWFVLHTRSRQEKSLHEELTAGSIKSVLPLVNRVRYYGTRRVIIEEPLFAGYMFLLGTREEMFFADRTKRVANVIPVTNQQKLDWELGHLQTALATGYQLDPYPYLKVGTKVEVRSGPFKGVQGVVDSKNRDRLIIQIETLGRAVAVEISGSQLVTV